MAFTLQTVLQAHLDAFLQAHRLPYHVTQALAKLRDCRTAALGGHVIGCPHGHVLRIAYNSCQHRSCPLCSGLPREQWLEGWRERLVETSHYHTIFTTPHDLLPVWRWNQKKFADLLFQAAAESLQELLGDEKYLGAVAGLLAALHTWSQTLGEHVHLHVLVTAGGLAADGRWRQVKKDCLLPRKVLMVLFRGKFRAGLRRLLERGELRLPLAMSQRRLRNLLNQLGRTAWNVKILERYDHGQGVATYLARYLKGGPLPNSRLIGERHGKIGFRYRDNRDQDAESGRGKRKSLWLAAEAFLLRWRATCRRARFTRCAVTACMRAVSGSG